MTHEQDTIERLRGHVDDLAAEEISSLLDEVRIEARAQVRRMLVEALAERMLACAEVELASEQAPRAGAHERLAGTRGVGSAERATSGPAVEAPATARAPAAASEHAAREGANGSQAGQLCWYVYGVVAEGYEPAGDVVGIDATHPLAVVTAEGVAAVASRVPLGEFGEDALTEQVNDLAWLEQNALRHEAILDRIREETTLVPMRLCTIYNSEQSVREMLAREHEFLADALARLEGRTEWGVKLYASSAPRDEQQDRSDARDEGRSQPSEGGPGASYLLEKRAQSEREAEAEAAYEACCAAAHERLSGLADEAKLNPLQPRELTKRDEPMLLNGVYLVQDRASDAFARAAETLQGELYPAGIELELTGPWPPYNFVNDPAELGR